MYDFVGNYKLECAGRYSCYYVSRVISFVIFFFKQKTAYEMRISDWSSDVCSSDLVRAAEKHRADQAENFFLAKCIVLAGCGEHLRDRVLARAFPPVVDQLADEAVEVHQRFSENI